MTRIESKIFGTGTLYFPGTSQAWCRFEDHNHPSLIVYGDGNCSIAGPGLWIDLPVEEMHEWADEVARILKEIRKP